MIGREKKKQLKWINFWKIQQGENDDERGEDIGDADDNDMELYIIKLINFSWEFWSVVQPSNEMLQLLSTV